jgi:hypothetical protein
VEAHEEHHNMASTLSSINKVLRGPVYEHLGRTAVESVRGTLESKGVPSDSFSAVVNTILQHASPKVPSYGSHYEELFAYGHNYLMDPVQRGRINQRTEEALGRPMGEQEKRQVYGAIDLLLRTARKEASTIDTDKANKIRRLYSNRFGASQ